METTIDSLRHELELARAEASRARHEARTDDMTGLGNRRGWRETTDGLQQRAARFAVVLFDVANLHAVNHALGHEAADDLLCEIATVVRGDRDLVFRLGGDEFAVVLAGAGATEARCVRDRIEAAVGCREVARGVVAFIVGAIATWSRGEDLRSQLTLADHELERRKAARKRALGVPETRSATMRALVG